MTNIRKLYGEKYYDEHVRVPMRLIHNPITNPITNPKRETDGNGKQVGRRGIPRQGICEICGRRRGLNKKQFALHHIAHESKIANFATIEVCSRCHGEIEGKGARYTIWIMEMGGVI